MTTTHGDRPCPKPRLRRTPHGWIAVSPRTATLRFAVTGATEDAARRQYLISYGEWREIQQRPDAPLSGRNG